METKVFKLGSSLAVRLPTGKLPLRKDGRALVIEETCEGWPEDFFEEIRIEREGFRKEESIYMEKKV